MSQSKEIRKETLGPRNAIIALLTVGGEPRERKIVKLITKFIIVRATGNENRLVTNELPFVTCRRFKVNRLAVGVESSGLSSCGIPARAAV
jgi:hypothetical protein